MKGYMLSIVRTVVTALAVMVLSQQALASTITVTQASGNQVNISLGAPTSNFHHWEDLQRRKSNESTWTNLSMRSTDTLPSSGTWYYRARQVFRSNFGGHSNVQPGNFVQDSVTLASAPPKPSISASTTSSTSGNYSISWSASSGATSYQWRENSGGWNSVSSSTRSRSFSNKANGGYTYSVRACNSVCSASSSVTVSVIDPPLQITVSPTTSTNGSYTISFSSTKVRGSTNGVYFKLEEKAPGGSFTQINSHATSSVTRTGKAQGTWQYRARPCVSDAVPGRIYHGPPPEFCNNYSSTKSVTVDYPTPARVGNLTLGDSEGTYDTDARIDVSWSAISGATRYEIRYGKRNASKSTVNHTGRSRAFTSLSDGVWEFETRACNFANECGSWSNRAAKEVRKVPSTPTNFRVSENPSVDGTYAISWSKPAGVVNTYEWRTRTNNGSWSGVNSQAGLSKSFTQTSQATYRYQVRACRAGGICSGFTGEISTVVNFPTPAKVGNLTLGDSEGTYDTDGRIDLSWTGIANATKYQIRYGKSGATKSTIDHTSVSRSFTGLSDGVWQFETRACNRANECGGWSTLYGKEIRLKPGVPTSFRVSENPSADGTYAIHWNKPTGVINTYEWRERANNSGWGAVSSQTGLSKSFAKTNQATYRYSVRACRSGGICSNYTSEISTVVNFPTPAKVGTLTLGDSEGTYDTNGRIDLSWSGMTNATKYQLRYGKSGSTKTTIDNTNTSRLFTGLTDGTWEFEARACNRVNECGGWSNVASKTVLERPDAPTNFSSNKATSYDGNYRVSWSAPSQQITRYELREKLSTASTWSSFVNLGSVLYRDFSGEDNGTYDYQVRACNQASCGPENSVTIEVSLDVYPTISTSGDLSTNGRYQVYWTDGRVEGEQAEIWIRENEGDYKYAGDSFTQDIVSNPWQVAKQVDGIYRYELVACSTPNYIPIAQGVPPYPQVNTGNCVTLDPVEVKVDLPPYDNDTLAELSDEGLDGASAISFESVIEPFDPSTWQASTNYNIGSTGGEFRVSESGAATYNIPIVLPVGVSGVTPEVSLSYSSQGQNGIAGQGWSLSASSSVMRCRQTLYEDGQSKAVTLTQHDRFCLGGNRLQLVDENQTYGAPGTEYRTLVDSYVRVKAIGGEIGNPDYFEVYSKDGSVKVYGASGENNAEIVLSYDKTEAEKSGLFDNDFLPAQSATYLWSLSKTKDSVGNEINYSYIQIDKELLLKEISYADSRSKVIFKYEDRLDVSTRYLIGNEVQYTQRLDSVSVYTSAYEVLAGEPSSSSLLREYRLTYGDQYPNTLLASRLENIQECTQGGCLSAVEFNWAWFDQTPGTLSFENEVTESDRLADYRFADINGDSCQDLIYALATEMNEFLNIYYKISTNNCTEYTRSRFVQVPNDPVAISVPVLEDAGSQLQIVDINADGRQDLAVKTDDDTWSIYIAKPKPEYAGDWALGLAMSGLEGEVFADINGDGLADLLTVNYEGLHVQLLERNQNADTSPIPYSFGELMLVSGLALSDPVSEGGFCDAVSWSGTHSLTPGGLGDFNGDGSVDLLIHSSLNINCANVIPHTNSAFTSYSGLSVYSVGTNSDGEVFLSSAMEYVQSVTSSKTNVVLDINSDGLSDLLIRRGAQTLYALSNGVNFEALVEIPGMAISEKSMPQILDKNNDGFADLVFREEDSSTQKFYTWNPSLKVFDNPASSFLSSDHVDFYVDINGDGQPDRIIVDNANKHGTNKTFRFFIGDVVGPNYIINAIDNGFGNVTEIAYEGMSNSAHYSRLEVSPSIASHNTCDFTNYDFPEDSLAPFGAVCRDYTTYSANDFYQTTNNVFQLTESDRDYGRPVFEMATSRPIVTRVLSNSPAYENVNHKSEVHYFYDSARIQAGGHGFLGFESLKTVDIETGVETLTTYSQRYPYVGMPLMTSKMTSSGHLLSISIDDLENNADENVNYFQPYLKKSTEYSYALAGNGLSQGDLLSKVVTKQTQDDFGNVLTISVETFTDDIDDATPIMKVETSNQYVGSNISLHGQSMSGAQLGRLSSATVTHQRNGSTQNSKTSDFTYYTSEQSFESGLYGFPGLLRSEKVRSDKQGEKLTTYHYYDSFGNKRRVSSEGWDGQNLVTRYSTINYDPTGRYINSKTNQLGQTPSYVVERDPLTGAELVTEIATGVRTYSYADDLGREVLSYSSLAPDLAVSTHYLTCDQDALGCPALANYLIYKQITNSADSVEYFDTLGRTIRSGKQGVNGRWVFTDTRYNTRGFAQKISEPFFSDDGAEFWTETSEYDLFGRPLRIVAPDSSETEVVYSNNQITTTNALGQSKIERKNTLGELVYVQDEMGNTIDYVYSTHGELEDITVTSIDAGAVTTQIRYDFLGRKISMNDPDKGAWQYSYNAFGELIRQTNANGHFVESHYDVLGRLFRRTDKRSNGSVEGHTRWYFDGATYNSANTTANAWGKATAVVQSTSTAHEACTNSASVCEMYSFDSSGRAISTSRTLDTGPNSARETFMSSVAYQPGTSRVEYEYDAVHNKILDDSDNLVPSGTQNIYNAYGYVIAQIDLASNDELYRIRKANVRGQIIEAEVGGIGRSRYFNPATGRLERQVAYNGGIVNLTGPDAFGIQFIDYGWDEVGNLKYRHNQSTRRDGTFNDQAEAFCYDSINRLTVTEVGSNTCTGGVNDQAYNGYGNITQKDSLNYLYGNNSGNNNYTGGLHAVTKAGNTFYNYDANGNMTNDSSGRNITYSTFDKPLSISNGSASTQFRYGPSRSRYYQKLNSSDNEEDRTTVYLGNVERIHRQGAVEWKRYVQGGIRTTMVEETPLTGGVYEQISDTERLVIFKDHLGSTDVIVNLDLMSGPPSGSANGVVQTQNFNVWGERREQGDWESRPINLLLIQSEGLRNYTTRGYTSHEMLDDFGIIHMNGRIYDAKLARFLQADPFVQAAAEIQMYNRYSYLSNNPLNATDPSGYFSLKDAYRGLMRADGREVVHRVIGNNNTLSGFVQTALNFIPFFGALASAHYSFDRSFYHTGEFTPGIKSAAIGYVSSWAFSSIGNYYQGLSGTGGGTLYSFGGNQLTAGQIAGQIFSHAMVGGVVSVAQGGKFGHGFISAGLAKGIMGQLSYDNVSAPAVIGRTATAAIVGGTTSVISGGKFANGAITAAMAHLYNQERTAKKAKGTRGKIGRKRLYPKKDRVISLSAEVAFPMSSVAGEMMDKILPSGVEYEFGVLERADGSAELVSDPALAFDGGIGGFNAVAALDFKYPDTTTTLNLMYGVGVRIHFNNEGVSGVGFGVGYSLVKKWIPSAKAKEFSGSINVSFEDL